MFGPAWISHVKPVAVGTIHELAGLPSSLTPVVLTPSLAAPQERGVDPILTVGRVEHVGERRQGGDDRQELGVLTRPQLDPVEPRELRQILHCGRLDPLVAAAHALLPP